MKAKKPTIADVAQEAGVSKTAVSYYLNHKHESLSKATIAKLDEVVQRLGYVCNTNYQRRKKTMQIGLLVTDLTDPFISSLCKGINDACTKRGYNLLIANTDNSASLEKKCIKNLAGRTDGLIINTAGMDDETLELLGDKTPVVLVDRSIEKPVFDVISSNNYDAVTELMQYLYGLKYTAFGLFMEELIPGTARTIRHKAFMDFSSQYQGRGYFAAYASSLFDEQRLMFQMMDFLDKTSGRKRVFIGVNGRTMLRVLSALNTLELKVPEDVGACGYDDFDWATILKGGVTTIQQPTYEIGYECVERLMRRINKEKLPAQEIHLRSRLIIRSTVR